MNLRTGSDKWTKISPEYLTSPNPHLEPCFATLWKQNNIVFFLENTDEPGLMTPTHTESSFLVWSVHTLDEIWHGLIKPVRPLKCCFRSGNKKAFSQVCFITHNRNTISQKAVFTGEESWTSRLLLSISDSLRKRPKVHIYTFYIHVHPHGPQAGANWNVNWTIQTLWWSRFRVVFVVESSNWRLGSWSELCGLIS